MKTPSGGESRPTLSGVAGGDTQDVTPHYITQGVACVLGFMSLPLRLMRTKPLATSPFTKALEQTSLADLHAERQAVANNMAALENHLHLLDLAIQWKKGDAGDENGERRPSLRAGIVEILNDSAPLRPTEIYAELNERGWAPGGKNAKAQVAARLSKLVGSGHLARVGEKGSSRYTLPDRTTDSG